MTAKIAIFYASVFILIFLSRTIWKWAIAKFGIDSIIYTLAISFPFISAFIGIVQSALHWHETNIVTVEVFGFLFICYSSYFLYRRTKGLVATFHLTRMEPTDGNVGCLMDFMVVGSAALMLAMQTISPYPQLFKAF